MFLPFLLVFISGGLICAAAQLLIDLTKLSPAKILVMYVCLGVLLFGVGAYEPLEKIFGAGVSVPLIGFGATIGRGVREAIDQSGAIGILTGGLTASACGIAAAVVFSLLFALLVRPKEKR